MKFSSIALVALLVTTLLASCMNDDGPISPVRPADTLATITSISPTTLTTCDTLTIRGRNFGRDTSGVRVFVGSNAVQIHSVVDSFTHVRVPIGVTGGAVTIVAHGDTSVSAVPISVRPSEWLFRRVDLSIEGLAVVDSFEQTLRDPIVRGVGPDTVRIVRQYEPDATCTLLQLPSPVLSRRISTGSGPSTDFYAVTLTPGDRGATFSKVLLHWSGFHYGGMLGSENLTFDAALAAVPYSRSSDGSIEVRLEGVELISRLRSFVYHRRPSLELRRTLEVVAHNPDAVLMLRLSK